MQQVKLAGIKHKRITVHGRAYYLISALKINRSEQNCQDVRALLMLSSGN